MPTSLLAYIFPVMNVVRSVKPTTVLDIGVGRGKYGLLVREYLEEYNCLERLDGVEAFRPYINKIIRSIYDNIYCVDIMKFKPKIKYDLTVMVDVLEHLRKQDGKKFLLNWQGDVVLTAPITFVEQGAIGGNVYEKHRSFWTPRDFADIFPIERVKTWVTGSNVLVFISGEKDLEKSKDRLKNITI